MFYTYTARFDVTRTFEKFLVFDELGPRSIGMEYLAVCQAPLHHQHLLQCNPRPILCYFFKSLLYCLGNHPCEYYSFIFSLEKLEPYLDQKVIRF